MENKQNNEEVDVFELFRYIGNGFKNLGNAFLRFFNFLLRNIIVLCVLVLIGLVAGYFLDKNTPEERKTEAIVASNFNSSEYLYKSIDEIESKFVNSKDTFFKKLGLKEEEAGQLSLEIEPVIVVHEISPEKEAYLELLSENEVLEEEEKQKVLNRSYEQHKIVLFHPETVNGQEVLDKITTYIRNNSHYQKVFKLQEKNLRRQIESNLFVLAQIDSLFQNYARIVGKQDKVGKNLVYSENSVDLGEVLEKRMELQETTGELISKKVENTIFLKIIDKGTSQKLEERSIFDKYIVLLPTLLVLAFFLGVILLRLRSKAKNLK